MKLSMGIMGIAVVAATLVSPVANAAWDGDILYAAQNRHSYDPGEYTWRYGMALAYCDYGTNWYGGQISCARQMSEPLVQNDGHTGDDVVILSRALVAYDSDTALMLASHAWGSASTRVYLTQLEYYGGATPYEDQGLANPGRITVYLEMSQPITDGGITSGRLQLAVDPVGLPGGGYDPNGDDGGVDPRLRLDATLGANGVKGADNVMDMAVDDNGHLYIAGRFYGTSTACIYRVTKANNTKILANAAGGRVSDAGVFNTPVLLVSKPGVSWYTGVAVDQAHVFATDYIQQTLDVYNIATGALVMSVDLTALPDLPPLRPEHVRVDPTYSGPPNTTRLILAVLDSTYVEGGGNQQDVIHLLVIDIDLVAETAAVVRALKMVGGYEHGHSSGGTQPAYTCIDWLGISCGGDLIVVDSRGGNDCRAHSITAYAYVFAVTQFPTLVAPIDVMSNSMWPDRIYDYARGAIFVNRVSVSPSDGDLDTDNDVDLDDYVLFLAAMNGPNVPPGDPNADLDGDNDCDALDLAIFTINFTGSYDSCP